MLKKIAIALVAIVLVLLGVGLVLPSKWHVDRSASVNASPEAIYPWVADLKKWPEWSPWNAAMDPTMKTTYEGAEMGVGAVSKWTGEKAGTGSLKITSADPRTGITYDLEFDNSYQMKGAMKFEPAGAATKVAWTDDGDMGMNIPGRYMALMMNSMVGKDFEKGLAGLKSKVESTPAPVVAASAAGAAAAAPAATPATAAKN